ncbi:MAG: hypothetical protein GY953_31815 [bacterium]|nr:hypothetical protein [bacterium]
MMPGNYELHADLAIYQAHLGNRDNALDALESIPDPASQAPDIRYLVALCHELLGNRKHAVAEIAKLLDEGYPWATIQDEPFLTDLRQNPQIKERTDTRAER